MTTTIRQRIANRISVFRLILLLRRGNLTSFAVPCDLTLSPSRDPALMVVEERTRQDIIEWFPGQIYSGSLAAASTTRRVGRNL
jgi:hypothetical protein